jgi:4-amino-4-deoxy-L-arabinose transferase-like glycosyltransferase
MNTTPILSRSGLLALFLAFTVIWFGSLDYRKLIQPDEGRYAEIAREMATSGNFITPRLNGIKYFEKPPLQYWTTAATFKLFGENEWTARIWPGLTGFLSVLLAFITANRLFGQRTALLASATLGSGLFTVLIGHINTLDMGLSFFLQLALTGMIFANHEDTANRNRRKWMLLVWAALALAMLTKGLLCLVVCGASLVLYSLLARDFSPWKRLELARGIPLFLAITAPWFVAVSLANPEFPHFFFIHEHFERFLTKEHGRYQPAWYFFAILLVGTLPWTLMTLQGWLTAWGRERSGEFQPQRFLFIWAAVILGFFSASSSKLPSYILPMAPALAILTGVFLANVRRKTLLTHIALIIPVAAAAVWFAPKITTHADAIMPLDMMAQYARWATIAATLWLAGTLVAFILVWRRHEGHGLITLAVAGFLALTLVIQGHETLGRSTSSHDLALELKPLLTPDVPFYSVAMYEQTLPFYLQRTLTLVNYRDELSFGLDQEPHLGIPTIADFAIRWRAGGDAFAVVTPNTYNELNAGGLPMTLVAKGLRRIVVRKPS